MSDVVTISRAQNPHLVCSLCQRTPDKINLSSCFHSFCPECLVSQVYNGGSRQCPICRTGVNVSEIDVNANGLSNDYVVRENVSRIGNVTLSTRRNDTPAFTNDDNDVNFIRVPSRNDRQVSFRSPEVIDVSNPHNDVTFTSIPASPRNTPTRSVVSRHGNLEITRTVIPLTSPHRNSLDTRRLSPGGTFLPPISSSRVNHVMTAPSSQNYNGLDTSRTRGSQHTSPNLQASPDQNGQPSSPGMKTCDICQDGRIAASRCLKCEQNFCQTCRVAHLKMKASRYHEQQPLMTKGQGHSLSDLSSLRSPKSQNSEFCGRHGNEVTAVCKRCDILICDTCKTTEHEGHTIKSVSVEATDIRKQVAAMLQRHLALSDKLKSQLHEAERRQGRYPYDLEQEMKKIDHQVSEMKLEIDRERERTEQELTSHYKDRIEKNNALVSTTQRQYMEAAAVKSEALDMLNSEDDLRVASKGPSIQRRLDEAERDSRRKEEQMTGPTLQFFPGDIDPGRLRNMFGGATSGMQRNQTSSGYISNSFLETAPSTPGDVQHQPKMIKQFSLPFTDGVGYVYGIAPVSSETAWVTLMGHSSVVLVSRNGTTLTSVDVGDITEDATYDGMGGCYVTCPGKKSIKHVKQDGTVETLVDDLLQDPHGITVYQYLDETRNGYIQELYVCFTEPRGSTTGLFEKPKGSVHVLANDGEDMGRAFMMKCPIRIDALQDSNLLCISDHSNGCVTICDRSGQNVVGLYTGDERQDVFKPLGVCFDENGHVIVADWRNESVTRVTQDGARAEVLVKDIKGPQSVAVNSGYLWVGGRHGIVQVYQLH